jgi:hypothetical protein
VTGRADSANAKFFKASNRPTIRAALAKAAVKIARFIAVSLLTG